MSGYDHMCSRWTKANMIMMRSMKRMHSLGFASKGRSGVQILYEGHEMDFQVIPHPEFQIQ